jgi:uncharacterized protein
MSEQRSSRQQVGTYLLIVFACSSVVYLLILRAHTLGAGGGLYVFGIMWCRALAAVTTLKLNGRNLAELTRNTGKTAWFIDEFGAILPLVVLGFGIYFWSRRNEVTRTA